MTAFMQVGVVPILSRKKRPHIVLVTARGKGRWLLPKGNQHPRHTRREMALTEAYEEAGVERDSMVVAVTTNDELNLLVAELARGGEPIPLKPLLATAV